MRVYEVRVHRGRSLTPERRWIEAASDRAASHRAERLFAETTDAIGIEVILAGERLHVRGVVPVAATPMCQRSEREQPTRLWVLMQRIELCRHRAELAEVNTAKGSATFRAEMAEIAQEWRDLARHIEAENTASKAQVGEAEARASPIGPAAPSGRAGGARRGLDVVVGLAIGALGALTLSMPRWIEASTGVDIDRGSGALEWAVTVMAPLAVIAAAFALRISPRRLLARIDRRRL
ncbi:MAG TPA: hypothetical protein VGF50_02505 [Caulobacteraceae bacterium]|jgi:hypothetical protein